MPELILGAAFRHALFVGFFLSWIVLFGYFAGSIRFQEAFIDTVNPWTEYGAIATCFNVTLRLLAFLAVPQTLFNFMGFVKYRSFAEKIVLKSSPLLAPFVCVRVVTRGLYPNLVKETVRRNLETLSNVGVENYVVQVVTDIKINLTGESWPILALSLIFRALPDFRKWGLPSTLEPLYLEEYVHEIGWSHLEPIVTTGITP